MRKRERWWSLGEKRVVEMAAGGHGAAAGHGVDGVESVVAGQGEGEKRVIK